MADTPLNQISVEKDNWNVKIRVIRMWDAINIANDHEIISLDMIMVDREVIIYLFLKYIYLWTFIYLCGSYFVGNTTTCKYKKESGSTFSTTLKGRMHV